MLLKADEHTLAELARRGNDQGEHFQLLRDQVFPANYQRALSKAGIPEMYWDRSWEDYKRLGEIRDHTRKYAETLQKVVRTGASVLMYGNNGSGKTGLATEILKVAVAEQFYRVRFITIHEMLELYKSGWKSDVSRRDFSNLRSSDLICIDEMTGEYVNRPDFVSSVFNLIVKYRASNRKATIITSNIGPADLGKVYGQWFGSILKEFICLMVAAPDFRPTLGKAHLDGLYSDIEK